MADNFSFTIEHTSKSSKARAGIIHTAHGDIKTPSFVAVGTQATVKAVSNEDLKAIGTQIFFVNTYHIYLRPGTEVINKFNGLHNFIGWDKPLITDSAGFQIFSLGSSKKRKINLSSGEAEPSLVTINNDGVVFRSHLDGSEHVFTPEKSIEVQGILGADLVISFDECTFYPATKEYSVLAMERTHRWALRCLAAAQGKLKSYQALYGVIQGGIYEDLRKESAKYINSLPFDGIAIGGVSVGESKKEMKDVLEWTIPFLDLKRPRHLLGVGEIDDIFTLVENGIDTFDCVMPTRLGRMGQAMVRSRSKNQESRIKKWTIDLDNARYSMDKGSIDQECECLVCRNYSRAYIHHLFRTKELLAYRLATYHNLFFLEKLVSQIRQSIFDGTLDKLKEKWLSEK